jgi:hypothetical protein
MQKTFVQFLRFLRRSVPSDPHLWFAFVVAAVYFLAEILHVANIPSEVLTYVIMICILTIVADRLKSSDEVRENSSKLCRIADSTFDKRVALRRRPSTPDEYESLWGGYTGIYYAYNPAYRLDKATGLEEVAKIFVHRYQNPFFKKAMYLFLKSGTKGQNDLDTFCNIMLQVKSRFPDVVKMIEARVIERDPSSDAEMYFGTRDGRPTAVLELKDAALGSNHGTPQYYLLIHDSEVIENHLKRHFDVVWDDERTKPLNVFAPQESSSRHHVASHS